MFPHASCPQIFYSSPYCQLIAFVVALGCWAPSQANPGATPAIDHMALYNEIPLFSTLALNWLNSLKHLFMRTKYKHHMSKNTSHNIMITFPVHMHFNYSKYSSEFPVTPCQQPNIHRM